ncbi:MAG: hypothetical protein M1819_001593 [Sarea resinae]|nr:MAG: hypothetical protein M1819_001593 [Sarea resinae]
MDTFQKHRVSLFNAFTREFNELDRDLRDELARRVSIAEDNQKNELQSEIERLREKASQAEKLEQENQQLRASLESFNGDTTSRGGQPEKRDASIQSCSGRCKDYDQLQARCQRLEKDCETLRTGYTTYRKRWDWQRKEMAKWKNYAKDCEQSRQKKSAGSRDNIIRNSPAGKDSGNVASKSLMGASPPSEIGFPKSPSNSPPTTPNTPHFLSKPTSTRPSIHATMKPSIASSNHTPIERNRQAPPQQTSNPQNSVSGRLVRRSAPVYEHSSTPSFDNAIKNDSAVAKAVQKSQLTRDKQASSDDATQGEPESELGGEDVKVESPDEGSESPSDIPILVSERSLKRKRPSDRSGFIIHGERAGPIGSATKPIRIKSEHISNSPTGPYDLSMLQEDNLDLDEVGQQVDTPKKRRALRRFQEFSAQRPLPLSALKHRLGRSSHSSHTAIDAEGADDRVTVKDEDSHEGSSRHPSISFDAAAPVNGTSTTNTAQSSRANNLPDARLVRSFNGVDFEGPPAISSRRSSSPAGRPLRSSSAPIEVDSSEEKERRHGARSRRSIKDALQPKSTNIQVLPRTSHPRAKCKPRRLRKDRDHGVSAIHLLTEDGQRFAVDPNESTANSSRLENRPVPLDQENAPDRTNTRSRLGSLLERPSPEKRTLSPAKTPLQRLNSPRPTSSSRMPNESSRTARNRSKDGLGSNKKQVSHPSELLTPILSHERSPRPATPNEEPFRSRPLHRLGLEHFKVNPNYNQGLDYAFTETIRNRDQRRCLPGCTRPECCGSTFRKVVELAGGLPPRVQQGLWDSSPVDDEDQQVLEEYLGDDFARRTDGISDADRRELLLQARTKQFADMHGKHRHAFERRATPPGFWRTDMPSTQEQKEDQEEARRMERRKVAERHAEAMRSGGRWLFRDE